MPSADSLHVRVQQQWIDPRLPNPPEYVAWAAPHISTSIVDSIGADTIVPHILTREQAVDLAEQLRADSIVAAREYAEAHTGHAEGLAPEPLHPSFGHLDSIGVLVVVTMLLACLGAGAIRRALRSYRTALWSVRRRHNAFDDTHTAPFLASIILAVVTIVFGGLALYCAVPESVSPTFAGALCGIVVAGGYYIFQYCAYSIVGYAFGTPSSRSMWLAGFTATMAYTGLALVVPVLLLLFVPQWHQALLWVCGGLFLAGKVIFIGKGFRIFYHQMGSLLYFILYLCALEIIPVLALYAVLSYSEALVAA